MEYTIFLNTETNEYPRHIGDLENIGWSSGQEIPYPWVGVIKTEEPKILPGQYFLEKMPENINGQWFQKWEIYAFTEQEMEENSLTLEEETSKILLKLNPKSLN